MKHYWDTYEAAEMLDKPQTWVRFWIKELGLDVKKTKGGRLRISGEYIRILSRVVEEQDVKTTDFQNIVCE